MGLCKCAKKKVTNQFCFEHNVHVCEHCMTTGQHQRCVVGDYLQWIDNSAYDPNCFLCKTLLNSHPCIRLSCCHIFHTECLNNYASQLPANTAPAGYACPTCSKPIFPNQSTSKSILVETLENTLSKFAWAREGIGSGLTKAESANSHHRSNGQPTNNFKDSTKINMLYAANNSKSVPKILHSLHNNHIGSMSTPLNVNNVTSFISTNSDLSFGSTSSMRSKFDSESRRSLLVNVDEIAEDKYQSKSPVEFLLRFLRSRSTYIRNHSTLSNIGTYKRFILLGIILFFLLIFLIHLFFEYGRESADNDPLLNPNYDPMFKSEKDT